jgi:hypothetical protein
MKRDVIAEVEVDATGRLRVRPGSLLFPLIWRAAAEVHWDDASRTLLSPKPRDWTYVDWFTRIIEAVKDEYGVALEIGKSTRWVGISHSDRIAMSTIAAATRQD